jgi:hypothetical protein
MMPALAREMARRDHDLVLGDARGRMRILAAIHSLAAIRAILECLGLPPRPPPIRPADPDPHRSDLYEAC